MPARNPPRLTLAKTPVEVSLGLPEEELSLSVETYFDRFDWDGATDESATLSAEDFFTALGP